MRFVRRTAELADLVHDLRRIERAEVLIESGPVDVPLELDDGPTERMHTYPDALDG